MITLSTAEDIELIESRYGKLAYVGWCFLEATRIGGGREVVSHPEGDVSIWGPKVEKGFHQQESRRSPKL